MAVMAPFSYIEVMNDTLTRTSVDHISVDSFLRGFEFRDSLLNKINGLDPSNALHAQLEGRVRILLDMIEESRCGRYVDMSLGMFAWTLLELDRFLRVDDEIQDTQEGGYDDDFLRIQELFDAHRDEIESFLNWKRSQQAA